MWHEVVFRHQMLSYATGWNSTSWLSGFELLSFRSISVAVTGSFQPPMRPKASQCPRNQRNHQQQQQTVEESARNHYKYCTCQQKHKTDGLGRLFQKWFCIGATGCSQFCQPSLPRFVERSCVDMTLTF